MSWAERMKEIAGQGIDMSAELASKAGELAVELSGKAADFGRETAAKMQDLGERGTAVIELKRLQIHLEKLMLKLGFETYRWLVEKNTSSVSTEIFEIKAILDEIAVLRSHIEEKEAAVKVDARQ